MLKIRKNNGITLVALIITIIILLLVAGITIGQLTGNGIFDNAKTAKERYQNSQQLENNLLTDYESEINSYIIGKRDIELTDDVKNYIDNKINGNSAISASTQTGYAVNSDEVKVTLDTVQARKGSGFSIDDGGIKIGAGINYVLVSVQGYVVNTTSSKLYNQKLYVNTPSESNNYKYISQAYCASASLSLDGYQQLIEVSEGDHIYLYDNSQSTGTFYWNSVTVVEF